MVTEIGGGGGEETAEKEKWGSGLGRGEAKGVDESEKAIETDGVERKVLGGIACGGVGGGHVRSGTDTEIHSSSLMTSGVRHNGTVLACEHGLEKKNEQTVHGVENHKSPMTLKRSHPNYVDA